MANMPQTPHHRSRGIYLLPNVFTTISLLTGFYAIVSAIKGHFDSGAIAILISMIMDFLDGRVARLTNTQSAFGAEYDSLTDMVAFGVAPAILMYEWMLGDLGKLGWIAVFIYTAAVALRLARFNTQIMKVDKRYFQGLSCTASAGVMATFIWISGNNPTHILFFSLLSFVLTVCLATLMVSNIRYYSFKDFDVKDRIPFVTLLAVVLIFAAVAIDPAIVLFVIFASYALSGPILTLWRLRAARIARKKMKKNS